MDKSRFFVKVINSDIWGRLFLWILDNKFIILVSVIIVYFFIIFKQQEDQLKELLLQTELKQLQTSLEQIKLEQQEILNKIDKLRLLKEENKKNTKKVIDKVSKLSSNEKKDECLEYIKRLNKKRGLNF